MSSPQASVRRYEGKKLAEEEPHVFAVAESALRALQANGK
jgi:myosin heavy subunit